MKQFSSDFLTTLQTVPNSCVFGLISDSSMQCFISHSSNLKARIGALMESFSDDTRLVIFDTLEDLEYKLLFCEKYKHDLSAAGYKIMNPRQYINYRVRIQYSKNMQYSIVVLYNARRDKKTVGVFKNINEAKEFVELYYKGELLSPVYCTNELTREYVKKLAVVEPKHSLTSPYKRVLGL